LIPCHLDAIRQFEAGSIGLTCDTQFPAGGVDRWRGSPYLWEGECRVGISLELDTAATSLVRDPNFWRLLRDSTHLESLATDLGDCVIPFFPMNHPMSGLKGDDLCQQEKARPIDQLKHRWANLLRLHGLPYARLEVAYDPFFPNLRIISALSGVLEPFGLILEPREDDYQKPWRECQLRLKLWSTPLQTALGLYLAREATLQKDLTFEERRNIFQESVFFPVQQTSLERVWVKSPYDVGFYGFVQKTLGTPLFVLRNALLRQPGLDHGDFAPGHVWSLQIPGVNL
jgi:hypothetical protein